MNNGAFSDYLSIKVTNNWWVAPVLSVDRKPKTNKYRHRHTVFYTIQGTELNSYDCKLTIVVVLASLTYSLSWNDTEPQSSRRRTLIQEVGMQLTLN